MKSHFSNMTLTLLCALMCSMSFFAQAQNNDDHCVGACNETSETVA